MAYCAPRGIPLSTFLAWPEGDQQAALTWQAYESRRCAGCGTHPDDWSETAGGDTEAYHAEAYQCRGCLKVHRESETPLLRDGKTPAMHIRLARGHHTDCDRCST